MTPPAPKWLRGRIEGDGVLGVRSRVDWGTSRRTPLCKTTVAAWTRPSNWSNLGKPHSMGMGIALTLNRSVGRSDCLGPKVEAAPKIRLRDREHA